MLLLRPTVPHELTMALYKDSSAIAYSDHAAFDAEHAPGTAAPHPGIYRCTGCGDEIAIAGSHTLPPQNHKQHQSGAKIKWQLIVFAVQK